MNINKIFSLILKFKRYFSFFYLFLKILGINNFFDFDFMCLNLNEDNNDDEKKSKKFNYLIAAIKITTPIRHCIYGLVAISIMNFSGNIDVNLVLTVFTIIEIVDKSIVTFLEEMDEEDVEKDSKEKNNNK